MVTDYDLPTAGEVRTYLKFYGWQEMASGPVGSVWSSNGNRIGVPRESDNELIEASIKRISVAEKRDVMAVAESIRFLLFDVTYLRAANDYRITDTIPLATASKILTSARSMLRASATTARTERAQIGNNYSKLGDSVVREALMGHTRKGSFVIPVLMRLPEPIEEDRHQISLDHEMPEVHRAPPEPFERRVVRTFAQSMQAMKEIVVEPARDPVKDQMHELVYRGVSREFCAALAGILSQKSVGEFEAKVDWAPAVSPPTTMQDSVSIDADAVDLVERVAKKLKQQKIDPKQVFSGTIVQLRHESLDDPYGEIYISTVRRGRAAEVAVRLPIEKYRQAWEWHNAGRAVLVEGIVRRPAPGKPLRVDTAVRCHPVDEMYLSTDT
ncbi:hypothetical protein ACGFJT_16570 [Actinomadura geliboluensis]|uniref:hypothetical protein n=1 Tax=Actinomadura geliboluensis TaxID=882440 RepID=UPI00371C948B